MDGQTAVASNPPIITTVAGKIKRMTMAGALAVVETTRKRMMAGAMAAVQKTMAGALVAVQRTTGGVRAETVSFFSSQSDA